MFPQTSQSTNHVSQVSAPCPYHVGLHIKITCILSTTQLQVNRWSCVCVRMHVNETFWVAFILGSRSKHLGVHSTLPLHGPYFWDSSSKFGFLNWVEYYRKFSPPRCDMSHNIITTCFCTFLGPKYCSRPITLFGFGVSLAWTLV